jgi:hypothetical protein
MNDLDLAKHALGADQRAFVIVKEGQILATGTRDGIAELLDETRALGEKTRGAVLADRIVGKAVAMVARAMEIRAVYTPLASQAARETLAAAQIEFAYEHLVPLIMNQRGDGPCPLERLTLPLTDPRHAVEALCAFVGRRTSP